MKIQSKIVDRFAIADRRFDRLSQKFAGFVETLEFFGEPRCPVRGILVTKTDDPMLVLVSYRTVTIGVRMLCELSAEGLGSGRVVCTLEKPSFTTEKKLLGSFGFNEQGFTDHEEVDGEDPIELECMAPEIVLSFLQLGLQQGAD